MCYIFNAADFTTHMVACNNWLFYSSTCNKKILRHATIQFSPTTTIFLKLDVQSLDLHLLKIQYDLVLLQPKALIMWLRKSLSKQNFLDIFSKIFNQQNCFACSHKAKNCL